MTFLLVDTMFDGGEEFVAQEPIPSNPSLFFLLFTLQKLEA